MQRETIESQKENTYKFNNYIKNLKEVEKLAWFKYYFILIVCPAT